MQGSSVGSGGSLIDNLQLEDVVTIKTDGPASEVRHTALTWSPLANGAEGETAIRYIINWRVHGCELV